MPVTKLVLGCHETQRGERWLDLNRSWGGTPSLLMPNQIYSIRLQATDIEGELREDGVQGILLDGSMRGRVFPSCQEVGREMPGEDWRPPVVADLDGDGLEEIVGVWMQGITLVKATASVFMGGDKESSGGAMLEVRRCRSVISCLW